MRSQALKFIAGSSVGNPAVCEDFNQDSVAKMIDEQPSGQPAVFVVNPDVLDDLRKLTKHVRRKEQVRDLGKQSPPKGRDLFKCFQGCRQIPFLEGKYKQSGRLVQGVTSFLERIAAIEPDEAGKNPSIFILGTTEKIFNELLQKTKKGTASCRSTFSGKKDDEATLNRILVQMLGESAGVTSEDKKRVDELASMFIGNSIEAQVVRWLALRAAQEDVSVLILGESGTGKEIVANIIHSYSSRAAKDNFFPLNCGAISQFLFEPILFGNVKIVHDVPVRDGILAAADGGTVFLDEIGELSLDHQTKLLRFLTTGKYLPVGANRERASDVRIIAATNRDLFRMVLSGEFREDLYYRLLPMLIRTPALRDHPEDIPLLAQYYWKKACHDEGAVLPKDVQNELQSHKWPGNVKELKFILKGMRVMFPKQKLSRKHLRIALQYHYGVHFTPKSAESLLEAGLPWLETLRHLQRVEELIRACRVCVGPLLSASKIEKQTVFAVKMQLGHHLYELERLLEARELFQDDYTLSAVVRFKEAMTALREFLPEGEKEARQIWTKETKSAHRKTAATLSRTIEKLISEA